MILQAKIVILAPSVVSQIHTELMLSTMWRVLTFPPSISVTIVIKHSGQKILRMFTYPDIIEKLTHTRTQIICFRGHWGVKYGGPAAIHR